MTGRLPDGNDAAKAVMSAFAAHREESEFAHHFSGCVAASLLEPYNDSGFPFGLTDFRGLDANIFEDCLRDFRMDSRSKAEVHTYLLNVAGFSREWLPT